MKRLSEMSRDERGAWLVEVIGNMTPEQLDRLEKEVDELRAKTEAE